MDDYLWVVFSGEYSDRSLAGVFSSREKAEAFIAKHQNEYSEYYIEAVVKVDEPCTVKDGYSVWITAWHDDEGHEGEDTTVSPLSVFEGNAIRSGWQSEFKDTYTVRNDYVGITREHFHTWVFNADEDRAKKVAYDRFRNARYMHSQNR